MKLTQKLGMGLLAATLGLVAGPAMADDDCHVPAERWQSADAVQQMASRKGWELNKVEIDDGCYEIRGHGTDGRAFKAVLNPETLDIMEIKFRNRTTGTAQGGKQGRRDDDGWLNVTPPHPASPAR